MKNIVYNILTVILITFMLSLNSCIQKDFDEPPSSDIPVGNIITLQDVMQIYNDSVFFNSKKPYKFVDDYSVYAVVSMDDKSGNIYRAAYIQDAATGLNLRLLSSGGLYQGDSIRLNLKNLVLSDYNGMIQLDSVHVDNNITKLATGVEVNPVVLAIGRFTDRYAGRLIKLEDVQFNIDDVGKIFANDQVTENRNLEDCDGRTVVVRTSGYANFASSLVPRGRGSLVGILSTYNGTWQIYIRSLRDLDLTKPRCGEVDTIFSMTFDNVVRDQVIEIAGWQNINQTGNVRWIGAVTSPGEQHVARVSNDRSNNITWLILPKQTIGTDIGLQFITQAQNAVGASLIAQISTDYNGDGNPENATWTTLPANIATSLNRTESGVLDLPTGEIYIAFKFTGNSGSIANYYLDDIVIFNKEQE